MTRSRGTVRLGKLIEEKFLRGGAGELNIEFDDIQAAIRKDYGCSLAEAKTVMSQRLTAARAYLEDDRSFMHVAVTKRHFDHLKRDEPCDWDDDDQLRKCVSGVGREGVGLHFIVDRGCLLFVLKIIDGLGNSEGKRKANFARLRVAAETSLLRADNLQTIAVQTGLDRVSVARELKALAASAQQIES